MAKAELMQQAIVTPDRDAIVTEIEIAAPPTRIFEALTDSRQLAQWFAGDETCPAKFWRMDARQGGSYSYATQASKVSVNGVKQFECYGEILEFDPPWRLVYTWIGNWHLNKETKTVVSWELAPVEGGTHVKVTHSGLTSEEAAREDYRGGWPGVMQNLKTYAERI